MQVAPETAIQSIYYFYKSQLNTPWAKNLPNQEGLWIDLVHLGQHLCRAHIEWKRPDEPQFKLWQYLGELGAFEVCQSPLPNGQTTTYFRPTDMAALDSVNVDPQPYPHSNRVVYTKESCLERIEEMAKTPERYPIKEFSRMRYIFIACCKKEESKQVEEYVANGGRREDFPFTMDPGLEHINQIIAQIKNNRPAMASEAPQYGAEGNGNAPYGKLNNGQYRDVLEFAFFGFSPQGENLFMRKMEALQAIALPDSWTVNGDESIASYFAAQFHQARVDNKMFYGTDGMSCAINTGLVDRSFRPIYALFKKNRLTGKQPWVFMSFVTMGQELSAVALTVNGMCLVPRPRLTKTQPIQQRFGQGGIGAKRQYQGAARDQQAEQNDYESDEAEASQPEQQFQSAETVEANLDTDDEFVPRPKRLGSIISFGKSMFGNR